MAEPDVKHATFVFERVCAAPVERVFQALSDAAERAKWGTPSESAVFFYEATDFRVGGRDVFRCGSKEDPQFRGVTTYCDIVPNQRIVSSEVIEVNGEAILISLLTTTLEPIDAGAKVILTAQVVSLKGDDMIQGAKTGHTAAMDNLAEAMAGRP
jgi:uncharacterized protein YndB with AHSA1/START domain